VKDTYEINPVDERKIVWRARRKLRKARCDGRSGLLAYSMIPVSSRSDSRYRRVVFIRVGARELYVGSPEERGAQWRDLAPANHRLTFTVAGAGFGKSV
jgi:hypothetical protein